VTPQPMAVYENTPAGQVRRAITEGAFDVRGDAAKTVEAMIGSVKRSPAPKRLTLGSSAYASIRAALTERLAALEAQKENDVLARSLSQGRFLVPEKPMEPPSSAP
jgi:hypothetical protein